MAEENVNRDEFNKLLRQWRLQVNNAKKEIFPLVHHFVGRTRNEDLEIDCGSLLEMLLETEIETTEVSDKIQHLIIDGNELMNTT